MDQCLWNYSRRCACHIKKSIGKEKFSNDDRAEDLVSYKAKMRPCEFINSTYKGVANQGKISY